MQPINTGGQNRLHRGRNPERVERSNEVHGSVLSFQGPFIEERLHGLFHEERNAAGGRDDQLLERRERWVIAQDGGKHLIRASTSKGFESKPGAPSLVPPSMRVFRPIADQKQNTRAADQIGEPIQKCLTLVIQPVQILNHHQERTIDSFRQEQICDGVQSAGLSQLRVHSNKTIFVVRDLEQSVQVRKPALQVGIEANDLGRDLLPARYNAVLTDDVKIAVQELDNGQIGRALAV